MDEFERYFEATSGVRYVASRLGMVGGRAVVSRDRRALRASANYHKGQWRYDFAFKPEQFETLAAAIARAQDLAASDATGGDDAN